MCFLISPAKRQPHAQISQLPGEMQDGEMQDLGDHPKPAIDDQVKSGHREKA
jgi:hypothetical protein